MPSKNKTRSKANSNYKTTIIPVKRVKAKKDNILIEVAKDQIIGEFINGFQVIKPVKRYGKYYVLVKNK
ncbi:hypothetical protein CLPUN_03640 [Clostridium puniceum]|uniref:Uncharacterized protein n=1 Tax=Clostridium puniceum TaxID=29367 RepID=A0A1S8TXT5_9CLOT|nr:hypothetical protein [Clostridium puniceum]OOM82225.1 hypothetical protein CLPUN_03640 [Clostridium puniceum]